MIWRTTYFTQPLRSYFAQTQNCKAPLSYFFTHEPPPRPTDRLETSSPRHTKDKAARKRFRGVKSEEKSIIIMSDLESDLEGDWEDCVLHTTPVIWKTTYFTQPLSDTSPKSNTTKPPYHISPMSPPPPPRLVPPLAGKSLLQDTHRRKPHENTSGGLKAKIIFMLSGSEALQMEGGLRF